MNSGPPDATSSDPDPQLAPEVEPATKLLPVSRRQRRRQRRQENRRRAAVEWVVVVVVALLAAFLVRTFVFQTFYIPSGSMEPTLQIGDRIIVSKLSYDLHSVQRGNIIVFHAPPREVSVCADPDIKDLVKRVIGLPGETISSVGNTILIDGRPIRQPWFPPTPLGPPIPKTTIPANSYFVLGDNRTNSCDSRMWGSLPGSDIIGHVVLKIWPLSQFGVPS
jgi:signal peptidase I